MKLHNQLAYHKLLNAYLLATCSHSMTSIGNCFVRISNPQLSRQQWPQGQRWQHISIIKKHNRILWNDLVSMFLFLQVCDVYCLEATDSTFYHKRTEGGRDKAQGLSAWDGKKMLWRSGKIEGLKNYVQLVFIVESSLSTCTNCAL